METKMANKRTQTEPYNQAAFATEPTKWTQFLRGCIIFQLFRFVILNLKVIRIVVGGHS